MLECHGMEVGLHPLSFVVDGIDFIAAAVDLDATDRPALRFAELLLALAALHVAGVAFTSIRHRENLVAAMLHGKKRATDADDAAGSAEQTKVSTGRKP
jgi:hypothetical protein